jgi:tetratricopeptide (TPR) repeat protein
LSPEERSGLAEVPTKNVEAYQAYLKGRYLAHQPHYDGDVTLRAITDLEHAIQLDSTFALAYAELARNHARLYYLRTDQSEPRRALATASAEKALALGPDQPEVHLAIGDYYNWAFRDKEQAMEHWSIAEEGLPNNAELLMARAMVRLAEGRMEESIEGLEKAAQLSPKDVSAFSDLAWAYMWAHRFPESIAAAERAIELAPDQNWPYLYRAISYFAWKGPRPEGRAALASVDHSYGWYSWGMYNLEVAEGNWDAAFELVDTLPDGWSILKMEVAPKELFEAFMHQYLGDAALATKKYKVAVSRLEKAVAAHPEDARYHSALGMALAGIGEKERAVRMGMKATELLSYTKDAGYGINPIYDLAVTYTLLGDFDKAFEQVEFNLSHPGYFTVTWMENDIRYAPLKKDPRYAELLKKYALPLPA